MPARNTNGYTAEGHEEAIRLAKVGNYRGTIARAAFRVHPDTLHAWLKRGREFNPETMPADHIDAKYAVLYEDLEQAESEWEATTVANINTVAASGAPNTWQAGMTMLERKKPDRWGKRETRVIEGDVGAALPQINILVLNDPDARRSHRDLLRSVDAGSRASTRLAIGPGVDSEREADSDGRDDLDVDTRGSH